MKTTLLVAAIAAGITLAASGAQARDGHGDRASRMQMPTFEQLDANGDGAVTPDEITAAMQAGASDRFAAADTNGDGGLSVEEMTARADADRAERMAERATRRLEAADTNGDGLLQQSEIAEAMDGRRGPNPDRMFDRADADDNGSLSAEEYAAAAERMQDRGGRGRNTK